MKIKKKNIFYRPVSRYNEKVFFDIKKKIIMLCEFYLFILFKYYLQHNENKTQSIMLMCVYRS